MWNRRELKTQAKEFLRKHYWKAFIAVFLTSILTGGVLPKVEVTNKGQSINQNVLNNQVNENIQLPTVVDNYLTSLTESPMISVGLTIFVIITIVASIAMVMIGYVVQVGQSKFFLDGFNGDVSVKKLLDFFNKEEYWPIVKTQFKRAVYTFMWTLLFIIPGIIKSIEYSLVPYILAEEPTLTSSEAINRSRRLTKGHKMDIFILALSFLPWYLLNFISFGLATFFINPYIEATTAKLYNVLSKENNADYEFVDFNKVL